MFEHRLQIDRPLVAVRLASASGQPPKSSDGAFSPAADHSQTPGFDAGAAWTAPSSALERDRAAMEQVLESITEAVNELEQRRQLSLAELQQAAVELAMAVASRLLFEKVRSDDFAVEELVGHVVDALKAQTPVTVRLHPDDLARLMRRLEGRPTPWPDPSGLRLVADASVAPGDCWAESDTHGILSRMELQLSEIRRHVMESLDDAQTQRRQALPSDQDLRRFPDRRESA